MLTVGSLFSGVGGLDLGLEQAGMKTVWQVEQDPYALQVLNRHWPNVPKYTDVRNVGKHNLERVDIVVGGFPCQDISDAGNRLGITAERSGLWREMSRIVRELRPRYVLVENVAALLHQGIGRVLGDLSECGYDAEWEVISACSFGAPHMRERVFVFAYSNGCQLRAPWPAKEKAAPTNVHFNGTGRPRSMGSWWAVQPEPCSVVYGLSGVVDELRGYGNAVCPPVAKWIGERIIEFHEASEQ